MTYTREDYESSSWKHHVVTFIDDDEGWWHDAFKTI